MLQSIEHGMRMLHCLHQMHHHHQHACLECRAADGPLALSLTSSKPSWHVLPNQF
jgi:hypothetical protein